MNAKKIWARYEPVLVFLGTLAALAAAMWYRGILQFIFL